MAPPRAPAIAPIIAPSAGLTGTGELFTYMFAAMTPPTIAHAQQQKLTQLMKGIVESRPTITPPIIAGLSLSFMSVYTFCWEKIGKLRLGVAFAAGAEELPPRRERQVHRARHEVEGQDDAEQRRRQETRRVRVLP